RWRSSGPTTGARRRGRRPASLDVDAVGVEDVGDEVVVDPRPVDVGAADAPVNLPDGRLLGPVDEGAVDIDSARQAVADEERGPDDEVVFDACLAAVDRGPADRVGAIGFRRAFGSIVRPVDVGAVDGEVACSVSGADVEPGL